MQAADCGPHALCNKPACLSACLPSGIAFGQPGSRPSPARPSSVQQSLSSLLPRHRCSCCAHCAAAECSLPLQHIRDWSNARFVPHGAYAARERICGNLQRRRQRLQAQDQAHGLEWVDLLPEEPITPEHFGMQEGMNRPVHITHPDRPVVIGRTVYGVVATLLDAEARLVWCGQELRDCSTRQVRSLSCLMVMHGHPEPGMMNVQDMLHCAMPTVPSALVASSQCRVCIWSYMCVRWQAPKVQFTCSVQKQSSTLAGLTKV